MGTTLRHSWGKPRMAERFLISISYKAVSLYFDTYHSDTLKTPQNLFFDNQEK